VRWERLKALYSRDYGSFRALFVVETMALLDKWREPTPQELNAMLHHVMAGGRIAIRIGRILDLFRPVWPLEVAKYEYLVFRGTWGDQAFRRRYFLTSIRAHGTALVLAWWAFETLMNDFASIIAKERRAKLDPTDLALLEEKRPTIDKAGVSNLEPYYQPLLDRLQFIYRLLTREGLDRKTTEWQRLVELKNTRDAYVHRIGKGMSHKEPLMAESIVVKGFGAVRDITARVLTKTPEFAGRFVYKYLAFWSCGFESPFIWDGKEGDSFYLGLGSINKWKVVDVYAPMPGSFSTRMPLPAPVAAPTSAQVANSSASKKKRKSRR
jgi:hypothetical protein